MAPAGRGEERKVRKRLVKELDLGHWPGAAQPVAGVDDVTG